MDSKMEVEQLLDRLEVESAKCYDYAMSSISGSIMSFTDMSQISLSYEILNEYIKSNKISEVTNKDYSLSNIPNIIFLSGYFEFIAHAPIGTKYPEVKYTVTTWFFHTEQGACFRKRFPYVPMFDDVTLLKEIKKYLLLSESHINEFYPPISHMR